MNPPTPDTGHAPFNGSGDASRTAEPERQAMPHVPAVKPCLPRLRRRVRCRLTALLGGLCLVVSLAATAVGQPTQPAEPADDPVRSEGSERERKRQAEQLQAAPPYQPPEEAEADTRPDQAEADQAGGGDQPPELPGLDAPRVDWSHAKRAYWEAEEWLRTGGLLKVNQMDAVRVSGLEGVRVTLRWYGYTIGWAQTDVKDYEPTPKGSIDLLSAVAKTLDPAMDMVREAIERRRQQRQEEEPGQGLRFQQVRGQLQLDIQLAYRPSLIRPSTPLGEEQPDPRSLLRQFSPGYHALRMIRRDTEPLRQGWVWPITALEMNLSPEQQMSWLMRQVGYARDDWGALVGQDAPLLERLSVIHIVRPELDQAPQRLIRGQDMLPPISARRSELEQTADTLGQLLIDRQRQDGSLPGDYHPSSSRWVPLTARPDQAMLVLYALARRAGYLQRYRPQHPRLATTRAAVKRGVTWLLENFSGFGDPELATTNRLRATALSLLTLMEMPQAQRRKDQRDRLAAQLLGVQDPTRGSFEVRFDPEAAPEPADVKTHAMILTALAQYYEQTRDESTGQAVRLARRWLWSRHKPEDLEPCLPWLGIAEFGLDELLPPNTPQARDHARVRRDGLRFMQRWLEQRQVAKTPPPHLSPADVVGGIDEQRPSPDRIARPDSSTAHAMAFLARSLREAPVGAINTRDRINQRVLTCGLACRFLRQLMMRDEALFYIRGNADELAMGAIRHKLWDNRLTLEASAMSLLACTEFQESLAYLVSQQ